GHQDGPEAQPPGLHDRRKDIHPVLATQQVDVVDQHDGVVHHDPNEHHEPHDALHVQGRPGQQQCRHHTDYGHGHREHHDERIEKSLELPRHHHVDEHDGHDDGDNEVALRLLLLEVLPGKRDRKAIR